MRFVVLNWVRNRHGNKTNPTIYGGDFVFYPHGENGRKYSFKAEYNKVRTFFAMKSCIKI